ncbi:MAG TPA: HNH endonuclease signature motif containing protein [Beijerinckiaceae bacterium]|nr:HNH endonuclease signature motif containing protein [Beijerinckiaceae bacterium]
MAPLRTLGPRLRPLAPARLQPRPKETDPHYGTQAHKAWRAEVLKRAGHRCEDCGAGGKLYADHVVEIRDGGAPLDPANGRALCSSCHTRKTHAERDRRLAR